MVQETIQHGEEVPDPNVEVMEGVEIVEYNVDKPPRDMKWEIDDNYPGQRYYYYRGMIIQINLYNDGAIDSVYIYKSVDDFAKVERYTLGVERPYSNLVLGTRSAPPFRLEIGRS